MDKSVVFAVAGSGKTTRLVNALDEVRRFLLVTYTEANHDNLRAKVIERFGYLPPNIGIYTYLAKCAHPPKFGHFVKLPQPEVL